MCVLLGKDNGATTGRAHQEKQWKQRWMSTPTPKDEALALEIERTCTHWKFPDGSEGLDLNKLTTLIAAHTREALEQQWQPIESAPKDGTTIWAENWKMAQRGMVYLNMQGEWELVDGMTNLPTGKGFYPTHWMPLPATPLNNKGGAV